MEIPHKGPQMRKIRKAFPCHDVIMIGCHEIMGYNDIHQVRFHCV